MFVQYQHIKKRLAARGRFFEPEHIALILLLGVWLFTPGCSENKSTKIILKPAMDSAGLLAEETWLAMGTLASLTVPGDDRDRLPEYTAASKKIIEEIEAALTVFNPASEVSHLNQFAGQAPVPVSRHTYAALQYALQSGHISRGCFDPTVAPLVKAWGFAGGQAPKKLIAETTIRELLKTVGYRHIVLSNNTVYFDLPGLSVDLGGMGKGYAVDACYDTLMAMQAPNVMINIGGNIRCGGTARQGRSWRIGIRNPFDREHIVGFILLSNGLAVATSGNYEQFNVIGNERYSHIIDPRTGYPVKGLAAVTIISTNAVETDGMSTAFFVLGIEESKPVLAQMPWCQALFIPDKQPLRIYVTPGFQKHFTPDPAFADKIMELEISAKKNQP